MSPAPRLQESRGSTRNGVEFVERQGGADDQLFGGSKVSRRLDATLTMRAESGRAEYRFALAHAHPDRFMFVIEAFRFDYGMIDVEPDWHHAGSGHTEAKILETAQSDGPDGHTASDLLVLLRRCEVYQFHDTSDDSRFKKRWDVDDNADLDRTAAIWLPCCTGSNGTTSGATK